MDVVIGKIREALKASADIKAKESFQRFFKEEVRYYGVKASIVDKIAKKYWSEVKFLGKEKIFSLCEELYQSDYTEEAFVVSFWLSKLAEQLEPSDLAVFKRWIEKYVNNWAKCDSICNRTIGGLVAKHPECIDEVKSWALSRNRWLKRAAAVSLIIPARKGEFLREVFEISDTLIGDEDYMVQKGYGWLLKEASRKHQREVLDYVLRNKARMPRTALRYAIELMPKEFRLEAMKRN